MTRKSNAPPPAALVILDVLAALFTIGPGLAAWTATVLFVWRDPSVARLFASPVVLLATFFVTLLALRLIAPPLKKGIYPVGLNRGMVGWYASRSLARASSAAGLDALVQSTYLTRFLHWRALGANIAYGVNAARDVMLMDLPMLTIGTGTTLSFGVRLSAHTFVGDRLMVAPVSIGSNVFLGMDTVVGPTSTIGDGAWLGMATKVLGKNVAAGTKIDNFAWSEGSP